MSEDVKPEAQASLPASDGYAAPWDTARVIQVIEMTIARRGEGKESDPVRIVTQYWTLDGSLIVEVDPCQRHNNVQTKT